MCVSAQKCTHPCPHACAVRSCMSESQGPARLSLALEPLWVHVNVWNIELTFHNPCKK